jgi:hypothetical protein
MSLIPRCVVCADKIDAYGRQGTRCARCSQPCPTCHGEAASCQHPLPELLPENRWKWVA